MWILWLIVITAILVGVVLLALGRGEGLAEEEPDDVVVRLPEVAQWSRPTSTTLRLPLAVRATRWQRSTRSSTDSRPSSPCATLRDLSASRQSAGSSPDNDGEAYPPLRSTQVGPRRVWTSVIDAPPQVVWDAVTDWAGQSEWMLATRPVRASDIDGSRTVDGRGIGGGLEAWTGFGRLGFVTRWCHRVGSAAAVRGRAHRARG